MNKTQEKAMQIIVNKVPDHLKDSIGHIHCTGDYAYSTDGYQVYRIPCTEKAIAYQNPEKTFTGIVIESDKGIGYIMPVIYSC